MAIWQYTFHVVHKASIDKVSDNYFAYLIKDNFDDQSLWKKHPIKKYFFKEINLILKKIKSWSNNIDLYGNQEANCFEVLSDEKNYVISVSFRIDFRSEYETILRGIIEFCFTNTLIILDENLNIASLNYEQLRRIIEASPQFKTYTDLLK